MSTAESKYISGYTGHQQKLKLVNNYTGDMSGKYLTGEGGVYDSHPALRRRAGSLSFKVGKGIGFRFPNLFYFSHFANGFHYPSYR